MLPKGVNKGNIFQSVDDLRSTSLATYYFDNLSFFIRYFTITMFWQSLRTIFLVQKLQWYKKRPFRCWSYGCDVLFSIHELLRPSDIWRQWTSLAKVVSRLSPARHQAIAGINAVLAIGALPFGSSLEVIWIKMHNFQSNNAFENAVCKIFGILFRPQYVNL